MPQRVLVVDDVDEVRALIRRVLSAGGYEVDVAATLAEARGLDPGQYDGLLVDAHLGPERGIDLIEELRSADPAAAGRCLLMTGGAIGMFPDGVACLAKPFQPGELLDAVRALLQPDAAVPDQRTGPATDCGRLVSASPAAGPPAAGRPASASPAAGRPASGPAGNQPATGGPPAWRLLGITRRLRARERNELVDFVHDGPLQDLTAATLELHMMRRSASSTAAQSLDAALQQLDAAAGSLRWLVEGNWPFLQSEDRLAVALQQRTAWLLAAPVTVDTDERRVRLGAIDIPAIVDVVELTLLATVDAGLRAQAHVAVWTQEHLIHIELILTCAAEDGQPIGDPATAEASLAELASALQASAHSELGERQWRVLIALRRQDAGGGS